MQITGKSTIEMRGITMPKYELHWIRGDIEVVEGNTFKNSFLKRYHQRDMQAVESYREITGNSTREIRRKERELKREIEKKKRDEYLKWLYKWREKHEVKRNMSCKNCLYSDGGEYFGRCYMNLSWRIEAMRMYDGNCCVPVK